ncbi:MAG: hypothetical protein ACD_20C00225G0026 [uncultured bacterium]|nr:MAG: hypothetical protein ACD_20C00225G0026 [uncultured bacterium]HBH18218.1 hypothetical protein [Cyanobacteria bacterium UBA9579]
MLNQVNSSHNRYNMGYISPSYLPTINNSYTPPTTDYQNTGYVGSQYMRSYAYPQIKQTTRNNYSNPQTVYPPQGIYTQQAVQNSNIIPWITDPIIQTAINALREVRYLPGDTEYMKNLGVNILYNNGEEAIQTILNRGLRVEFGPVSNPKVHAQLDNDNNLVIINEKYRGNTNPAVTLAISEAIFHELGHAKDNDGISSIQEEINCLALNTLANRYHQQIYPQVFNSPGNAEILDNGVSLYTRLFFDPNPKKEALVNRIIEKYGNLPMESPNHNIPLSAKISEKLNLN